MRTLLEVLALVALACVGFTSRHSRAQESYVEVELNAETTSADLTALCSGDLLRAQSLHISGANSDVVRQVLCEVQLKDLEQLAIADMDLYAPGASLLAECRTPKLKRLKLERASLGEEGWSIVSGSRIASALEHLTVVGERLDMATMAVLCSGTWTGLRSITLHSNGLTAAGLRKLFMASFAPQLTTIAIGDNPIGDRGADALACESRERLPRLAHLVLDWSGITDKGVELLSDSDLGPRLEVVSLRGNRISDLSVRIMTTRMSRIRELSLGGNRIGDDGVRAMLESQVARRLELVELMGAGVTDRGAQALLKNAERLDQCRRLLLRGNSFSQTTQAELRSRFGDRVDLD